MKPPPVLDAPLEQSFSVANLHFDDLKARYGRIVSRRFMCDLTHADRRQSV